MVAIVYYGNYVYLCRVLIKHLNQLTMKKITILAFTLFQLGILQAQQTTMEEFNPLSGNSVTLHSEDYGNCKSSSVSYTDGRLEFLEMIYFDCSDEFSKDEFVYQIVGVLKAEIDGSIYTRFGKDYAITNQFGTIDIAFMSQGKVTQLVTLTRSEVAKIGKFLLDN